MSLHSIIDIMMIIYIITIFDIIVAWGSRGGGGGGSIAISTNKTQTLYILSGEPSCTIKKPSTVNE